MIRALILSLLLSNFAFAGFMEAMHSVCSIGKAGTGFVFDEDQSSYWILTAGHVVENDVETTVCFYINGKQSKPYKAHVEAVHLNEVLTWSSGDQVRDLAVLRLSKDNFRNTESRPQVIPIDWDCDLKIDDVIFSCGCPHVEWPTAYFGRINNTQRSLFSFQPKNAAGRSGSPVFDASGRWVVGVAIWSNDKGVSTAISTRGMRRHNLWKRAGVTQR